MDRIDLFAALALSKMDHFTEYTAVKVVREATRMAMLIDGAKKIVEEERLSAEAKRLAAEAERLEKEAANKAAWEKFISRSEDVAAEWSNLSVEARNEAFVQFIVGMHACDCNTQEQIILAVKAFTFKNLKEALLYFPDHKDLLTKVFNSCLSLHPEEIRSARLSLINLVRAKSEVAT